MFSHVFLLCLAFLRSSAAHLELIFVCGIGRGQDTFFPHIAIRVSWVLIIQICSVYENPPSYILALYTCFCLLQKHILKKVSLPI